MYINWSPLSLQTERLITGDRCKATDAVGGEGLALLIGPKYLLSRKFSFVIREPYPFCQGQSRSHESETVYVLLVLQFDSTFMCLT